MTRKDPFYPAFDGLPLLSDEQFGGLGLFLLRFSYLMIASMPLVLSLLDAIAGMAANILYAVGMIFLCLPFLLDCVRKFAARACGMESLLILIACGFLIWNKNYFEAAVLIVLFHFCDVLLCGLLRRARRHCMGQVKRVLYGSTRAPEKEGEKIHFEAGEILGADCRVLSGDAVCSLCYLDLENGEFEICPGDVLFAGTEVVEGAFDAVKLSSHDVNGVRAIRSKLKRCLYTPSKTCSNLRACSVNLQTLYLLLILLNVTFFDIPVSPVLLAFSSVFLCFDYFLRFCRALELELLFYCLRHGIFPESMDVLWSLHHKTQFAKFLGGGENAFQKSRAASSRFILRRRGARRSLLVVERASESSALITGCDVALMYRTSNALSDVAYYSLEVSLLFRFCSLLLLVGVLLSFLLLDLNGRLWVSALTLGIAVLFAVLSSALAFARNKKKN